jgi:alpha-tubulin suppressor-like RCC1 family protein
MQMECQFRHNLMRNKRRHLKTITCILIGLMLSFNLYTFLLKKLNQRTFGHITSGAAISQGEIEPQLLIRNDNAIFLSPNGNIWIWGGGNRDTTFETWTGYQKGSEIPIPIQTELRFIKIETAYGVLFGLDDKGMIWTLGNKLAGLNPTSTNPNAFQKPFPDKGFIDISVGIQHVVALKNDGSIWTWSWAMNRWDQRGQTILQDQNPDSLLSSKQWLRIGFDSDWAKIKTTNSETYGIKTDGSLWRWQNKSYSNPSTKNRIESAVQITDRKGWKQIAADHGMAVYLHQDGSIWGEGKSFMGGFLGDFRPTGPGNFGRLGSDNDWQNIMTDAWYAHSCTIFAQKRDGSWWASGYNRLNNLALDPDTPIKTTYKWYVPRLTQLPDTFSPWAMATGYETTLVMTRDGQLWNTGRILGRKRPESMWNSFAETINRFNILCP